MTTKVFNKEGIKIEKGTRKLVPFRSVLPI